MEVHLTPAQEAFLHQRVRSGRFATTDEAVREAVSLLEDHESRSRPVTVRKFLPSAELPTGASLVQAMQASPYKEIDLESPRPHLPVRDVAL